MTAKHIERKRPARRKWKRVVTHNQEWISAISIAIILALNWFIGAPKLKLLPLHPLHVPSIEPTYHVVSFPSKFLYISYLDPVTGLCLKGADDFCIVVFWILVWTLARSLVMRWFWQPIAKVSGVKQQDQIERFAEQGWGLLYAVVSWVVGMTILVSSPYSGPFYFGPSDDLFEGYPHFALTPLTKYYYLVQMAFWTQTMIALNLEKHRKDFWHMFTHHIITFLLLSGSYATNFTRVGNLILCQMDVVDMILPIAKMFKYVGFDKMADVCFGIFLVSWVLTRHFFYPWTVWSVMYNAPSKIHYRFSPEEGAFFNAYVHAGFMLLLSGLQVILCLWLYFIVKVVQKVLRGENADDVRSDSEFSDNEDSEDDEEEEEEEVKRPSTTQNGMSTQNKLGGSPQQLHPQDRVDVSSKPDKKGGMRYRLPSAADAD